MSQNTDGEKEHFTMESKKVASGFGARKLHPEEIRQSLPTYEKLKEQIEQVRHNAQQYKQKNDINEQNAFAHPQVINNFAILGSRGTGKSSILKTLYEYLNTENQNEGKKGDNQQKKSVKKKNILLPPIVPENLVSHISLMGCLLGLLKPEVENIAEEHRNKAENTMCLPQKHPLEKEYSKLMAEYVQLQQPYEQISVQEFSTDADYVRRMTSVFEAGNQFAIRFRNFIDKLLKEHSDDTLLFVFIDDVDLSTNRCGDVVKTLLSYLSHPSIVTVLAGDLEVFGEALTLDFLRQEQIPDTKFIDASYLVTESNQDEQTETLIERKKQLAYEYLKKVMPPNNRHHILRWTLSMRGDFRPISMEEPASDREKIPSLRELLVHSTDTLSLLKHYFSNGDSEVITQTGQKISDFILYHIFDSTARGLMSGYYAITQLAKMDTKNSDAMYADIKFVLESIVAANYRLSSLQDVIFNKFLVLGTTLDTTQIRFDNFNAWAASQLPYLKKNVDQGNQNKETAEQILDKEMEIQIFRVFTLLDWVVRQLKKEQVLQTPEYDTAKRTALCLLCVNGGIIEKSEQLSEMQREVIYHLGGFIDSQKEQNTLNETLNKKTFTYTAIRTYFQLSFPLAVRYFQVLDISNVIDTIIGSGNENTQQKVEKSVCFIQVLQGFYGKDDLLGLAGCLAQQTHMLYHITRILNMNERELVLSMVANEYFKNDSISYGLYCFSGWEVQSDGGVLGIPEKIIELDKTNQNIGYILSKSDELQNSDYRNLEVLKKKLHIRQKISLEENSVFTAVCYKAWSNMFRYDENSPIAAPFYHTYIIQMNDVIQGGGKYIQPVETNLYRDPYLAEQIDVIKQIDKADLWCFDQQSICEEGIIDEIKKYIYSMLIDTEEKLINLEENMILSERSNTNFSVITLSDDFKKAYKIFYASPDGVSNTLSKKCKLLLGMIISKNSSTITTLEYVAVQQLMDRLILSNAWYGRTEGIALLRALEQCECNLFETFLNEYSDAYNFWFHCYCRYRAAECSESVYVLADNARKAMKTVDDAMKLRDTMQQTQYFKTLSKASGIDEKKLRDIPQLFQIKKEDNRDQS